MTKNAIELTPPASMTFSRNPVSCRVVVSYDEINKSTFDMRNTSIIVRSIIVLIVVVVAVNLMPLEPVNATRLWFDVDVS